MIRHHPYDGGRMSTAENAQLLHCSLAGWEFEALSLLDEGEEQAAFLNAIRQAQGHLRVALSIAEKSFPKVPAPDYGPYPGPPVMGRVVGTPVGPA